MVGRRGGSGGDGPTRAEQFLAPLLGPVGVGGGQGVGVAAEGGFAVGCPLAEDVVRLDREEAGGVVAPRCS